MAEDEVPAEWDVDDALTPAEKAALAAFKSPGIGVAAGAVTRNLEPVTLSRTERADLDRQVLEQMGWTVLR